ncbi:ATP-binding protein [Phenylobacterium sp.]|uniref:ATP-binding protein n=1 Tax=Phenylobacterium sp. TaxID=1871053 RepID=UPI0035ADDBC7
MAPLIVALLGARLGLAWAVALVLSEAAVRAASRPFVLGRPIDLSRRLAFLTATLSVNFCWIALSLLFWFDPSPGSPFIALIAWACVLLGGISFAFRSRLATMALAAPVTVVMLAAPVLAPRFGGAQQALVIVGLIACAAYAWISARRNLDGAHAVARASAELAAQKHAAEAANRAKSAFLAMMSHELRTPMNGVLGMAHALETTALDRRQREYLHTLIRSGDGLMAILDDVLDLARIEAGRMEVADEAFDLHDVVVRAQGLWRQAADDKGLSMACEIAEAAPAWVRGDGVRVRQILLNLISNAVKFTEAGEVRVALRPARGGGVELAVSDTGMGIDEATRAGLFQSFTQAEAGGARRHGGVGLGLAISQDLARLMGGMIEVDTEPGRGSTFYVRLPLAAVEPPAPAAPAPPAEPGCLAVLVVDDNAANRAVAVALLEALGALPRTAADGAAALAALNEASCDLVLMDIHMPGMDGVEVARRIRAGETGDPEVPIMALTADAMAGARERLLAQGFDDYLTKPISPARLAQALARVEPRA